jgi:hypothetical protein
MSETDSAGLRPPAHRDAPGYALEPDDEMSQEEQARLLVEPSFDHEVGDEDELLRYEFGPPDDAGYYGRGGPAPEGTVEPPSKAGPK